MEYRWRKGKCWRWNTIQNAINTKLLSMYSIKYIYIFVLSVSELLLAPIIYLHIYSISSVYIHIYGVFHGKSDGFGTPCYRFN